MATILEYSLDGGITWQPQPDGFVEIDTAQSHAQEFGLLVVPVTDECRGTPVIVSFPPVALSDELNVQYERSGIVFPLSNDADPLVGTLTLSIKTPPQNGVAVVGTKNEITYTPNAAYFGSDSISYRVANQRGEESTGIISITVAPPQNLTALLNNVFNNGSGIAVVDAFGSEGDLIQAGIDVGNTGVIDFIKFPQNNSGQDFIELSHQGQTYAANSGDRFIVRVSNDNFQTYDEATFIFP